MKSIRFMTCVAASLLFGGAAMAQGFPNKPIRVLIGYAPGGPTDLVTRIVVQDMAARMGQSAVAENRPGASGMIAIDALLASPADGYTIEVLATPTVVASILANKAVDPTASFSYLGFIWDAGIPIQINPEAPYMANVRTLRDLVAAAKANPGKINYSSAGAGSTGHLFGARFAVETGIDWTHVGYKGMGPAGLDMMAGRLQMLVGRVGNDDQLIKDGKLRVLASTGPDRFPAFPDAPSMIEAGFGDLAVTSWAGLIAPVGTPKEAVDRMAAELRTTLQKTDIAAKMAATASPPKIAPVQDFSNRVTRDYRDFARVIKAANIKVE